MLELWRKRLNVSALGLSHEDPTLFVRSQWQRKPEPNVWYLAYRVVTTAYLLIAWLLSIIDEMNIGKPYPFHLKWLIYLTNWGFTFCLVQALLCTTMLVIRFSKIKRGALSTDPATLPNSRLYKIYWYCFTIGLDVGIAITLLYWIVIFNPKTMDIDYLNMMVHCTNSIIMIIELCIVAHPVRLMHFYVPVTIGLVYSIFSLIYHLAGGTSRDNEPYIYPPLNWAKPLTTFAICMSACCLLMIIHCVTYVVYRIRLALAQRLLSHDDDAGVPVGEQFHGFENNGMGNLPV